MGKSIIMCFDGTSENFGPDPFTNVLKIYRLLDTKSQLCYYQPGIGTSNNFDSVNTWTRYLSWSRLKNVLDSMFAFCLDDHIVSAYLFLMKHYEVNDQIYMFGFSRGAFIARVLAGMLERVGLLNDGLDDMVHMAWKIYENWEFAEQPLQPNYATTLIQEFTKTFCRDYQIKIHFQGLFDSVNSVGLFRDRLFPCTQRSNIVNHVRHALSIDERRGKFKQFCFTPNPYEPTFFNLQYKPYEKEILNTTVVTPIVKQYINEEQTVSANENSSKSIKKNPLIEYTLRQSRTNSSITSLKNDTLQEEALSPFSEQTNLINDINSFLSKNEIFSSTTKNIECSDRYIEGSFRINRDYLVEESLISSMNLWTLENNSSNHSTISPDLIEKWFPGDHSDIGGGVFSTTNGQVISNLSLRWMLGEAIKHGVKFKPGSINKFNEKYTSMGSLFSCVHDFLNIKKAGIIIGELNKGVKTKDVVGLEEIQTFETYLSDNYCLNEENKQVCQKISRYVSIFWWILEFLPIGIRIEDKDGKWKNRYVPNMGRSRCIPEYGQLHWSIIWLIKFNGEYRPKNLPRYVRDVLLDKLKVDLPSIKTLDTLTLDENTKRRDLYKLINQWIEDNWETVPDDLYELLKDDPTL
ncbi:hypothetical protein C6P44_000658 [Monosporozyma unispora]|nr:hypothetical protein C6P44_000658 [Kazachstania unispora]